ncbi:MAG: hypothetical protein GY861_05390 [bacterium]|nr:hypothetical protein [bacterium]
MKQTNKEVTIKAPDGFEIDLENSDLKQGIVKFKPVPSISTYEDVAKELMYKKQCYYLTSHGNISGVTQAGQKSCLTPNCATNYQQLEAISALNKLVNVANYLNEDWVADGEGCELCLSLRSDGIDINSTMGHLNLGTVQFKSYATAQKAIDIMGDELHKILKLQG